MKWSIDLGNGHLSMIKREGQLAVELRMVLRDRWKKNSIEVLWALQKTRLTLLRQRRGLLILPERQERRVVRSIVDAEEVLPRVIVSYRVIIGEETISVVLHLRLMVSWYSCWCSVLMMTLTRH